METTYPSYREVFSADFVPATFHHREKQIAELTEGLKMGWHCYCEGEKGTGKTLTLTKFKRTITDRENLVLYMPCRRDLIEGFADTVQTELDIALSWIERRRPENTLMKTSSQTNIRIILDDIQRIVHFKIFNGFLHGLYERAIQHHKNIQMLCIGTLGFRKFSRFIEPDVQSRYNFKPIYFPPYDATELTGIVAQRLDLCNMKYDYGALSFIGAKVRRLGADPRLAFEIARNACEVSKGDKITEEVMVKAWDKTKTEYWATELKKLDQHLYLLILSATVLVSRKQELTTKNITNLYTELCKSRHIEALYPQRIYTLLKRLTSDEYAWLSVQQVLYRGRKGRTTLFKYEMTAETILKAFKKLEEEHG